MGCKQRQNLKKCTCTFECEKKGICFECVEYHRKRMELPGCYFSKIAEANGDRTIKNYVEINFKK
ncbi:MAG: DUF6485 family protein [archaeon]